MKPILLWTERPVPLERELETHAWMEANRAEVERRFEVIFDNAPGDWRHYSKVFRECWTRAGTERRDFFNLESDVVPSLEAWDAMLRCQEMACCTPYVLYGYNSGKQIGYGAVIEQRCPGGWDSHLARSGEERAVSSDLGASDSPRPSARVPIAEKYGAGEERRAASRGCLGSPEALPRSV